ncbi:MAG: carboxypeptidase-like regulatory domain-containing protein [Bryobacteraceae bacterium]|nr:carboxypeptidase-like regulatory domain-containing protein [Bryobacteraceae bacterium]MDW8377503.1 carboxypeptidase-like regulatory domain-containing protein [Bryobacterales bacterium]
MRILFFGALLTAPLYSQTFGSLSGTIWDQNQGAVAAATVTVTNQATAQARRVATSESGVYRVPFLTPGFYEVAVEAPGFKRTVRRDVQVQIDVATRLDLTLEIGQVTESVEVVASNPLLNTENAAVGTVIENKRIIELPLNGRNWLQMVALSPNVSAEMRASGHVDARQGGERGRQAISIAGQRQFFNRFTLDGVENTDVNYNTYVIRPSVEALNEFKIQTGIYSAEFGRATAQINATTKSGGNDFHGAVFHFLRNDKLDAKEWLVRGDKNPFRRNQFGYVWTGRIIRDRLFFMSNFEGQRDMRTLQGLANVAPTTWRNGDFSQQSTILFDPLTREYNAQGRAISAQPFPGNRIPANRLHSISRKLLEFYPEATVPGENIVANYVRQRKRPLTSDQFTQRFDFNESQRSAWFGRFSLAHDYERRLESFEVQEGGVNVEVLQTMVSNTRTLSPTVVNETRFGFNRFNNDLLLHFANRRDVTKELGIRGLVSPPRNAWGTPAIQLGGGLTSFGESGNGPWIYRNRTWQFLNNTSMVRGKHTWRFGGEMRRDIYAAEGNTVARGRLYFQGLQSIPPAGRVTAANIFADFMMGYPQRAERALGLASGSLRAISWYGYVEDTWRVTPKLTLNIGLRYELTPPWYEPNRRIMNIQMFGWDPARIPIMTRAGKGDFNEGLEFRFADVIPTQVGDDKLGKRLVHTDYNDFAPRLGIAWSPSAKWTVRTGAGFFYAQDQGNPRFDMVRNIAGRGDFTSNDQRPEMTIDDPWRFERQTFTCTGWSGNCVGIPFVLGNVVSRRTPYVMQWLFNIQRQVTDNLVFETGYMGNSGVRLERLRSTNEPFTRTDLNDTRTIAQRRVYPMYGIIQQVDGVNNSNYHALNVKVQQRFSGGLTALVGYTWSRAIDNGSGIRSSAGEQSIAAYDWNLKPERGLSQFHTAHRFVTSLIYDLPTLSKANVLARQVFGGWQTSSILTFSTGNPVRVGTIGDTNNMGGEGNYPDATGISPFLNAGTVDRFWNRDAFDITNPELRFRFGNTARNTLIGPGYRQWDFSLLKNFAMPWEGHKLQFRWEAFNFTNHPNWNFPSTDVRNVAFGVILSARDMRQMQFALKYLF